MLQLGKVQLLGDEMMRLKAGRHGIRSSELKRKFQEALPDSQIND